MMWKIKKKLKKIRIIYGLNSRIKARINSRRFGKLRDYYSAKAEELGIVLDEQAVQQRVLAALAQRGVNKEHKIKGKLKIFWVGANLSQDESGFLQGLRHFAEVILFKNEGGGYGLAGTDADQRHPNIIKIIESNSSALFEQVNRSNIDGKIDLVLGQMWADVIDADVLIKIQNLGIPVVNISMDDKLPALWGSYLGRRVGAIGLARGVDLTLTTTPDVCLWYQVEGYPAIYWHLASDPQIFYPRGNKKYDVVFVGSNYGLRSKLVNAIEKVGIHVDVFGPGWLNGSRSAAESAEIFGRAKIILGTGNIGYNEDIFTIKLRDFDAPMSGALYLTHRNPDLLRLFKEGEEIECYISIDECVKKIKYYLDNPDMREKIASSGLAKAKKFYSWEKRIKDLLFFLGFSV